MEIYLDANATTPVLPAAREAALAAMAGDFGNPSSSHSTGLRARALLDDVRASARRVLGAGNGQLLFTSGATEGIQTAVLSALASLRAPRANGAPMPGWLLYGATEHKAVPEALRHWNALLGLQMDVRSIPVGRDGRHDLAWLRRHAPRAGLVCTMAANNETGVISDLDGIADALADSPALWMVDSVQALGKLPLNLAASRIDYAPFSGHKACAPKGIGLLYVRAGAPLTPLLAGGGQEGAQRSGTENMPGIAALGAVLAAIDAGYLFQGHDTLAAFRAQLTAALQTAFAGLLWHAPAALSLPTTLNFSVPGLSSKLLLDLFDAAGIRVSGGSACSAAKADPSHVLEAMGLPAWQAASAIRLSFAPTSDANFIAQACQRIRACGESLHRSGSGTAPRVPSLPTDGVTRWVDDGACCYLLADAASRRCVVIDPLPALLPQLLQRLQVPGQTLAAVLHTRQQPDNASAAAELRTACMQPALALDGVDGDGWPVGQDQIGLGAQRLTRQSLAGREPPNTAYLLHGAQGGPRLVFVGDALEPVPACEVGLAVMPWLQALDRAGGPDVLLLPAHDEQDRFASTPGAESKPAANPQSMDAELTRASLKALLSTHPDLLMVDVREPYEQALGDSTRAKRIASSSTRCQLAPLSDLINALPGWLALPADQPVLFFCRSGNRSAKAAGVLRRLGHRQAFSLTGGLAQWPADVDQAQGAER